MTKIEEKIEYFKNWQEKIIKLVTEAEAEKSKYKAEFKATFGICDGEQANALNIIEAIKAVNTLS